MLFFLNKKEFEFFSITAFAVVIFFFFLSSVSVLYASSYQKIAPGDTITLGELVFDDDFVAKGLTDLRQLCHQLAA